MQQLASVPGVVGGLQGIPEDHGQVVVSPQIEQLLLKRITGSQLAVSPLQNLSNRELEVFQLMAQGEQTSDISRHLCISVKTVQTHHAHINKKLGAANTYDLRRIALTWRDQEGRQPS
jgi:DNA-binding NarL/FixJ family response regulator